MKTRTTASTTTSEDDGDEDGDDGDDGNDGDDEDRGSRPPGRIQRLLLLGGFMFSPPRRESIRAPIGRRSSFSPVRTNDGGDGCGRDDDSPSVFFASRSVSPSAIDLRSGSPVFDAMVECIMFQTMQHNYIIFLQKLERFPQKDRGNLLSLRVSRGPYANRIQN